MLPEDKIHHRPTDPQPRAGGSGFGRTVRMLIAALLYSATPASTADLPRVRAGSPIPACTLDGLLDDKSTNLAARRGRVTYIDFWASWCAPCAKAFPFLNRLHAEFSDRGLTVIGISVDERRDDARRFLDRNPARFALALDSKGACPRAFGLIGMPSSFLIDRAGIVRAMHVGFREGDADARRAEIERVLAEAESPLESPARHRGP